MRKSCATCDRYYRLAAEAGECRLNPPSPAGWPQMRDDDWCAQYEPKQPKDKRP